MLTSASRDHRRLPAVDRDRARTATGGSPVVRVSARWSPARAGLVRAAVLVGAGALAGTLAAALGHRALDLAGRASVGRPAGAWTAGDTLRVEDVVELGAALVGAALATWFCLGLGVAAACALARSAGQAWVTGERLVLRAAPVAVRRALVLSTGAGVALATATVPAVALAPPPDDLGWAVTADRWPTAGTGPGTPLTEPGPPAGDERPAPAGGGPETGPGTEPAVPPGALAAPATPSARTSPAVPPVPTVPPVPPVPSATASALPAPSPPAAPPPAAAPPPPATAVEAPDGASVEAADPPATPVTGGSAGGTAPVPTDPAEVTVVVRPGDTLWDIASRHLPAAPTDADVASAWPSWYAANAAVVGPDPDLIVPGQRLRAPAAAAETPADAATVSGAPADVPGGDR